MYIEICSTSIYIKNQIYGKLETIKQNKFYKKAISWKNQTVKEIFTVQNKE